MIEYLESLLEDKVHYNRGLTRPMGHTAYDGGDYVNRDKEILYLRAAHVAYTYRICTPSLDTTNMLTPSGGGQESAQRGQAWKSAAAPILLFPARSCCSCVDSFIVSMVESLGASRKQGKKRRYLGCWTHCRLSLRTSHKRLSNTPHQRTRIYGLAYLGCIFKYPYRNAG